MFWGNVVQHGIGLPAPDSMNRHYLPGCVDIAVMPVGFAATRLGSLNDVQRQQDPPNDSGPIAHFLVIGAVRHVRNRQSG